MPADLGGDVWRMRTASVAQEAAVILTWLVLCLFKHMAWSLILIKKKTIHQLYINIWILDLNLMSTYPCGNLAFTYLPYGILCDQPMTLALK